MVSGWSARFSRIGDGTPIVLEGGNILLIWLTSLVLLLIGFSLGAGGIWLALLGGSWYYILSAIGFLLTAVLLSRRSGAALWVYALVILGSLGWAVYEVGFDWWQLGARGGVIVLLGFWLLTPWIRRPLNKGAGDSACRWPWHR